MLAVKHLHAFGWIAALFFVVLPGRSQAPLREQLQSAGVPISSFTKAELDEAVDGTGDSKEPYVYFVYVRRDGDSLTGFPHLIRYDQTTGAILRSELQLEEKDPYCCGSPEGIEFLDDYLLLYFHYNPSAGAVVVLDQQLKNVAIIDGFDIRRVAKNQVVVTENMVHFAPEQPEKLQFVDLSKDRFLELYPLKNDALRSRFDHERVERMPAACKKSVELCDYRSIDEACAFLGGDGQGTFALDCGRSANYQAKQSEESVSYLSDSTIYIYKHTSEGLVYCEQTISEDEATALDKEETKGYDKIKSRCTPKLAVVPDSDR